MSATGSRWSSTRIGFVVCAALLAAAAGLAAAVRPDFDDPLLLKADIQAGWSRSPAISRLEPQSVVTGATFVLRGTGFGLTRGGVTLGGESVEVLDWNDFAIRARAPATAGIGTVVVATGGHTLECPVKLTVHGPGPALSLPAIDSIDTPSGTNEVLPGDAVVLHGHGFGTTPGYAFFTDQVTMRGLPFADPAARGVVTSWSDTEVEATVATYCAGRVPVVLVFGMFSVPSPDRLRCPE